MGRQQTDHDLRALTGLVSDMESQMLQDVLRQAGIPVLARDTGSGGYLKIYMGYSVFGETLYVHAQDYDRAVALLQALRQNSAAAIAAEQPDALDDATQFEQIENAQLERRIAGQKSHLPGILIWAVALLLLAWQLGR